MMEVLANIMVEIIMLYLNVTLYILNIHSVIYQSYNIVCYSPVGFTNVRPIGHQSLPI